MTEAISGSDRFEENVWENISEEKEKERKRDGVGSSRNRIIAHDGCFRVVLCQYVFVLYHN